ncbi:unnamed protein product, partial [Ectocarpus sp. 12 AP-2014]
VLLEHAQAERTGGSKGLSRGSNHHVVSPVALHAFRGPACSASFQDAPRRDENHPSHRVQNLAERVQAKAFRHVRLPKLRGLRGHSLPNVRQPSLRDQV